MKLQCDIHLPASKSESNRALMIAAYGGFAPDFQNLSDSQDTLVLMNALSGIAALPLIDFKRTASSWNDIRGSVQRSVHVIPCRGGGNGIYARTVDAADCGTTARFMTTFLAMHEGNWLLTGSERMRQRPMAPLVEALKELGAEIQYVGQQGFLPLQIEGKTICGGKISLDMSQSSQFASSLLLAAPMWSQGLELELLGQLNSLPYLNLTLSMMQHFGAKAKRVGRKVIVESSCYQSRPFVVSADWSAASYWYEMAALSEECEIRLHGLSKSSVQGDSLIQDWMNLFGVVTIEEENLMVLRKEHFERRPVVFDFSSTPDLFPTMAATCAGLQVEAKFTNVANLGIKESDRIETMKTELSKIGVELDRVSMNEVVLKPASQLPHFESSTPLHLNAHGDHRIVMALAPLSMKIGYLAFDHPEVVGKSYPSYWNEVPFLKRLP